MASCRDKTNRNLLPAEGNGKDAALLKAMAIWMMVMLFTGASLSATAETTQRYFPSAEVAVRTMAEALASDDTATLLAVFGPGSDQLVASGDPVSDRIDRNHFLERFKEKHLLKAEGEQKMILIVGNNGWPFSIPIVRTDDGWRFDTEEGKKEILARRIGRNELSTIQVCLAYVDAQREYASKDWNGDGRTEYAQRFAGEPGKKNSLYWKTEKGEVPSPLGRLVAEAQASGYKSGKMDGKPHPYHGYLFRILKAQGKDARGGAYDYRVGDRMIGGFGLVAYPAQYGASGIMTFITNHEGQVYEKDLGENTPAEAKAITLFNPGDGWERVRTADKMTESQ